MVTKTYSKRFASELAATYSSNSVGNCFSRSARTLHFAVTRVRCEGRIIARFDFIFFFAALGAIETRKLVKKSPSVKLIRGHTTEAANDLCKNVFEPFTNEVLTLVLKRQVLAYLLSKRLPRF